MATPEQPRGGSPTDLDAQHAGQPHETIRVRHSYPHPPERVYDAWLDPASARQWFFATPAGEVVRAEIDPRVGGRFTLTDRRDGEDIDHVGEYIELDRPWRIVFTFAVPKYTQEPTRVTIEISRDGAGSALTLTHENVWADFTERTAQGWATMLSSLGQALGK